MYAAASWVRLACRQDHASPETLQYSWRGSCRGSGHTVYDIAQPLLDEESWAVIWLKTTSVECLDHFRCTVYETEGETLTEIASEDFVLDHVSGEIRENILCIILSFVPTELQGLECLCRMTCSWDLCLTIVL